MFDNVETMAEGVAKTTFCAIMHSMTKTKRRNVFLLLTTRDCTIKIAMQTGRRMAEPRTMELPAFNDRESEAYLERFIREDAKKSLSPEMFQRQIDLVVKNCQVSEGKR